MAVLHRLVVADRVVSLGLLAAGLSHHIRNSLVAVKTFLDLVPSKLEAENLNLSALRQPDFWKEYYGSVQGQVEKINDLLKNLWLASENSPFQFSDKIVLSEIVQQAHWAILRRRWTRKKSRSESSCRTPYRHCWGTGPSS